MSSLCTAIVHCPIDIFIKKDQFVHIGTEALLLNRNKKYPRDVRKNILSVWEYAQSSLKECNEKAGLIALGHPSDPADYYQCLNPEKISELFHQIIQTLLPYLEDKDLNVLFIEFAKKNDLNSLREVAENYHKKISQETLLAALTACKSIDIKTFILNEFEIFLDTACYVIQSLNFKLLDLIVVKHSLFDYNDFLIRLLKFNKIKAFEILMQKLVNSHAYCLSKFPEKITANFSMGEILQLRIACKNTWAKKFLEIPLYVACQAIINLSRVVIAEYINVECENDCEKLLLTLINNDKLEELKILLDNFVIDKNAINFCAWHSAKNNKMQALKIFFESNCFKQISSETLIEIISILKTKTNVFQKPI